MAEYDAEALGNSQETTQPKTTTPTTTQNKEKGQEIRTPEQIGSIPTNAATHYIQSKINPQPLKEKPNELEPAIEGIEASAANLVDSNNDIPKIQSAPTPVKVQQRATKKSSGSGVIPVMSGLIGIAAIGIGAKAYLDKKRKKDDEEELTEEEKEKQEKELIKQQKLEAYEEREILNTPYDQPLDEFIQNY